MKQILKRIKEKRQVFTILLLLLLIASFVRLYRINDYMHFLGDEGRDVLVVKRIIIDHKLTFLGPVTSVGSIYLGPIYYYFMVPFLFIFNMEPVGPAVMIALFSVVTIILIYLLCLEFFNLTAGVISSLLYALSPLVIVHSRFSWNPNAVPLFALLIIYSLLKIVIKNDYRWFWILGLCLGIILQLHYLALVYIPLIFLVLFIFKELKLKNFLFMVLGSIIVLSPFIAFEIKNSFPNTKTALEFVTRTGGAATLSLAKFNFSFVDITTRAFWRLVVIESNPISKALILLLVVSLVLIARDKREMIIKRKPLVIILIWFLVSLVFLSLYQGAIYDYYMVIFFPFPPLITAIVFSWLFKKNIILKILTAIFLLIILYFQIINSPIKDEPHRLVDITKLRSKFIIDQTQNKPYNFALVTGSNSDHAYRYFFELWGRSPITIENSTVDPKRQTVTDQLLVLCEVEKCQPLGHPLWEIAGFGRAEIVESWYYEGAAIYKLVHYNEVI